jgi:hypothetical protein
VFCLTSLFQNYSPLVSESWGFLNFKDRSIRYINLHTVNNENLHTVNNDAKFLISNLSNSIRFLEFPDLDYNAMLLVDLCSYLNVTSVNKQM